MASAFYIYSMFMSKLFDNMSLCVLAPAVRWSEGRDVVALIKFTWQTLS
jgi:hypothetical protein